ncbi:cysteine--tRNA ligase [Candidatus Pantoea carbekii]|uniref:Cysteine--tRNA ligase n=1 Tax=Candidatus Pantoea carbekii TaxID=1235990 RepID=U3U6Y0_9GAMM|nr:cysteine--tRNA ligase [Candidatus Pantoea carbekii]AKC32216.1 cysteinyl-tRNA synthetase [Candidatus Pantoea carbekii]BAO00750.1 Cysteinyl-tRNA synthetase [Candidatus Pantoea carbekii]
MLKIYNTLSRQKEIFKPIDNTEISMYVCGVTVYDLCHIGHMRTFITFDVVARYLRYLGYKLKYVRNITDIDDKIIKRAHENGESITRLTNRMIEEMHKDFAELNILPPDSEPRATDHIQEIIALVSMLLKRGHAYIANNGDVMFNISSNKKYGLLSGQKLDQLRVGIRAKTSNFKRNLADFVLWKISNKIYEPSWNSPWGKGRPGWHIECSAMTFKQFNSCFDIHGGGTDLIFPHHENEIAQSTCACTERYATYWMHTGMVMLNHEKMSKSIGNFFTIRDILSHYDAETIRYFLMSAHYRSGLNYCEKNLNQAYSALKRLYIALRHADFSVETTTSISKKFETRFCIAMNDDFNIPEAYSVLFDMAHTLNQLKAKDTALVNAISVKLRQLANILGILQKDPERFLKNACPNKNNQQIVEIEQSIKMRTHARRVKNWKKADEIRDDLYKLGIVLEDDVHGTTTWHYIQS